MSERLKTRSLLMKLEFNNSRMHAHACILGFTGNSDTSKSLFSQGEFTAPNRANHVEKEIFLSLLNGLRHRSIEYLSSSTKTANQLFDFTAPHFLSERNRDSVAHETHMLNNYHRLSGSPILSLSLSRSSQCYRQALYSRI